MNIFRALQKKPEHIRKRIFWVIIIVFSLILFIFWIKDSIKRIENFEIKEVKEKVNLSGLKEDLNQIPGNNIKESFEELKDETERVGNMINETDEQEEATSSQEQATSSQNEIPIVK